ncbi:MAG: hypothetical protein WD231_00035 [Candidatus Woykebacteria bacterium]
MEVNVSYHQFKDLFSKAQKTLILIGGEVDIDTFGAALALKDVFKSNGKSVDLVCPETLPTNLSVLSGADEIKKTTESKSLIISFDYAKNPIEKISYKIVGDSFNLVIKPRGGSINLDEIKTSFVGGDYNLIITLCVKDIRSVESYQDNKEIFDSLPLINIDTNPENIRFGKLNIINHEIGSLSALLALLLDSSEVALPKKSAELLLNALREKTQNFTQVGSHLIFEAAAICTKLKESEQSEQRAEVEGKGTTEEQKNLPKEWLSPKVYRSSKVS